MEESENKIHWRIDRALEEIGRTTREMEDLGAKFKQKEEERLLWCRRIADSIVSGGMTTGSAVDDYFVLHGRPEYLRPECHQHQLLAKLAELISQSVGEPIMTVEGRQAEPRSAIRYASPGCGCFPSQSLLDNVWEYSVNVGVITMDAELSIKFDDEKTERGFNQAWLAVTVKNQSKFGSLERFYSSIRQSEGDKLCLPHLSHLLANNALIAILGLAIEASPNAYLAAKVIVGSQAVEHWLTYDCHDFQVMDGLSRWLIDNGFATDGQSVKKPLAETTQPVEAE